VDGATSIVDEASMQILSRIAAITRIVLIGETGVVAVAMRDAGSAFDCDDECVILALARHAR
jgi:hypothetical protein